MRSTRACTAALVVLALAASGCGSDKETGRVTKAGDETAGTNTGSTGTTGTGTSTGATEVTGAPVGTIDVKETEYALDPANPKIDKTGVIEIKAANAGKIVHALEFEGPDGEIESGSIKPGASKTFKVKAGKAGVYTWYCPIANHKQLGMRGKVTIGGVSAEGGGSGTSTGQEDQSDDNGNGGSSSGSGKSGSDNKSGGYSY